MGHPSIHDRAEAHVVAGHGGPGARTAETTLARSPRRLILAGMAGIAVMVTFFLAGTFAAVDYVDSNAVGAELARAAAAVEMNTDPAILASAAGLRNARVVPAGAVPPGDVSVAVPGGSLMLAWTPRRFASEAFATVAPPRLLFATLVMGCIVFIMLRLNALANDLEARRLLAHDMACSDALTGLRNRLRFDHELREAFQRPSGRGTGLALLYLDLDGFKAINDTLGHLAGDQLLRLVGERLTSTVAPADTIARLGGDEFAIIRREGLSRGELDALAFCIAVGLSAPFDLDGVPVEIGASVGIARAPADATTAAELVRAADRALYRAKADGGRRFAFADDEESADDAAMAAFAGERRAAA